METTVMIHEVLEYFEKVVFAGDLSKLIGIARQGKAYERELLNSYMATPAIGEATRTRNVTNPLHNFNSSTARCAVPMAMSLFATVNFLGALIEPKTSNNFEQKLMLFLSYAEQEYPLGIQKLLSSIYRHGLMHAFFTKVTGTEIFFDPDDTSGNILSIANETVTLNVMALYRVVLQTFHKLSASHEARILMQRNIPTVLNMREDSVTLINKLKRDCFKFD